MPRPPTATSNEPSRVSTRTERLGSAALPHGLAGRFTSTEAGSTRCACPPPASFSGADCDSADQDARSSLTQPLAVPLQSVSSLSSMPRLNTSLFESTQGPLSELWARALETSGSGTCGANQSASAATAPGPTTRIFFMAAYSCQSSMELQPSRSRTMRALGSLALIKRPPRSESDRCLPVRPSYFLSPATSSGALGAPVVNCQPNLPLMHRLPDVTS